MPDYYVKGQTIYLRPLTVNDASKEYRDWLNDKEVNKYLETREATVEELKNYIQKHADNPDLYFFGIFDINSDKHIGNIKLEVLDKDKKTVDFGILIGDKEYWGKGIGSEATKLAIEYAFDLGFQGVELGVIGENEKAKRVFEKCGFKITEIRENKMNHNGIMYDQILMLVKKNDN